MLDKAWFSMKDNLHGTSGDVEDMLAKGESVTTGAGVRFPAF